MNFKSKFLASVRTNYTYLKSWEMDSTMALKSDCTV